MYDLVLKGGTVVDPSSGLDGIMDVAVEQGLIARIAPGIPATEAARAIEVRGKIVTPGLIDLHAHVFEGVNRTGVNPDLGGVYSGVTTIVDAGSSGSATFGAFPRHILPHCHTEIVPFLHICQTGLATMPDIIAESSITLDDTVEVASRHAGLIRGIKARGETILGYGASTKGNVILQFCGLGREDLPCIAEVNEDKFGAFTPGTAVPIVSEAEAKALRPDYLLVLPWHFRDNILQREAAYLRSGGKLVFPLPDIETVG